MHLITLKDTHTHTLCRTPLDEGSARRRDFSLATKPFTRDRHAPGRIRTRNPSKRLALDPRHRPHGHQDLRFKQKQPSTKYKKNVKEGESTIHMAWQSVRTGTRRIAARRVLRIW